MENVHFRRIGPSWLRESIQQISKTLGKISILASWAQVGFQDGGKMELARSRTRFQNLQTHYGKSAFWPLGPKLASKSLQVNSTYLQKGPR